MPIFPVPTQAKVTRSLGAGRSSFPSTEDLTISGPIAAAAVEAFKNDLRDFFMDTT